MANEQLPPLEIFVLLKSTADQDTAQKQGETVKNQLEKLAGDFKLEVRISHKSNGKFYPYLGGKTSKETYEKVFGAELAYDIDLDYSSTKKLWIVKKPATIPQGFEETIQEVGLDYW